MRKDGPCFGCAERRHLCWAECETYKDWKTERTNALLKEREGSLARHFLAESVLKGKKRNRRG